MRASIAAVFASLAVSSMACTPGTNFKMTFYGWPDNSPPGNKVAMNCGGRGGKASGTGTYEDPLTMASEAGRFADCELVYSPYLKKYLRNEDTCANCSGDWVDVWTGSSTSDPGSGIKKCQESLTGTDSASHTIVQAPPNNYEVDAANLYANGVCNTGITFPTLDKSISCTGGSTSGTTPTTPSSPSAAAPAPASSSTGKKGGKKGRKHRQQPPADDSSDD